MIEAFERVILNTGERVTRVREDRPADVETLRPLVADLLQPGPPKPRPVPGLEGYVLQCSCVGLDLGFPLFTVTGPQSLLLNFGVAVRDETLAVDLWRMLLKLLPGSALSGSAPVPEAPWCGVVRRDLIPVSLDDFELSVTWAVFDLERMRTG